MTTDQDEKKLDEQFQQRFAELPKPVQDAITSADIEKRLRALSETHKLHLDQWQTLENEVMLALLGFSPMEELAENIRTEVGTDETTASALALDISKIVFEPVRQELERVLEHPAAKAESVSDVDAVRTEMLATHPPSTSSSLPPPVRPATPPPSAPTQKAERGPASGDYKSGEPSHERKSIVDDPYREPPQ